MAKKIAETLVLGALCTVALGQHAQATLFSMSKALKISPLFGFEMSLPIWGPSAESFSCIEHLPACQPQPKALR